MNHVITIVISVSEWLRYNRLSINAKKTKVILFGTKNKLSRIRNFNLTMGGEILERVWFCRTLIIVILYIAVLLQINYNYHKTVHAEPFSLLIVKLIMQVCIIH